MRNYPDLYFKAILQQRDFFKEQKIEIKDSAELFILSTIIWEIMMPFLPFLVAVLPLGRRLILWLSYNLIIGSLYSGMSYLLGKKKNLGDIWKALPFSYLPLIMGSLPFPYLFLLGAGFLIVLIAALSENNPPLVGVLSYSARLSINLYWVLIYVWIIIGQAHLLMNVAMDGKRSFFLALSLVIVTQIIALISCYLLNRLLLWYMFIY